MDLYVTWEQADEALKIAEADVAADMGEDAVEECYHDIVDSVAQFCTPSVRAELRRTTGTEER